MMSMISRRPSRACSKIWAISVMDEAAGLEVELDAGDPVAGAGDLEVHVAEEVLLADDVGDEDLVLVVVVGEAADGDARDRCP